MAFLVSPLLADLGLLLTETASEVVGSNAGKVIGSSVIGGVTSKIVEATQNGLDQAARNILGNETVDSIEKNVQDTKSEVNNAINALSNQDPSFLVGNLNTKTPPNTPVVPKVNGLPNNYKSPFVNPLNSGGGGVSYDPLSKILNKPNNNVNQGIVNQPQNVVNNSISPTALGKIIVTGASSLSTNGGNVSKSIADSIGGDPQNYTISQKISNFFATQTTPNNDQYNEIAKVYNGKNLIYPFVNFRNIPYTQGRTTNSQGKLSKPTIKQFYWNDETGQSFTLNQNTGLIIPAVYGNFVGPNSPNNNPPIDLLDSFATQHDQSWSGPGGSFNLKGDYAFVSRLAQNKQRFPSEVQNLVNSTIVYFSTLGQTISKLKGSLPDEVASQPVPQMTMDDVFPVANPQAVSLPPAEYVQLRYEFFKDLDQSVKSNTSTNSIYSQDYRSKIISQYFENILVQVE